MKDNLARHDAAVTDRQRLTGSAYADGRHLAARQSLYRWQQPRYDLPGIVSAQLADVGGTVVDVGCGNGRFLQRLRSDRPERRSVGLDVSAGILKEVPEPVLVADAGALPFGDGSVSAVIGMHMLYHVTDIDAAVAEFARVLEPGGVAAVSTNSDRDKWELEELWKHAAGDVLGVPEGPSRVSLSSRFSLEEAPGFLGKVFGNVREIALPGVIEVTSPEPVVAHLASYQAWADECGVPFEETVRRARERVTAVIADSGSFRATCRGGILVCRP
ncbi:MAG TPA: SAM-dependent methyltransferase [Streptomyces sp.]|nr:SAM-dependent methyltransferase [Streptomyces sp.]